MIVIPIYDMLLLPEVNFYFKKDVLGNVDIKELKEDEDVLFLIQRVEKKKSELCAEDFFEKGLVGKIESIDDEGSVCIRVLDRVRIEDIEKTTPTLTATATICPPAEDLPDEERKAIYHEVKEELLQFVQGFPWGVVARSFIKHWHSLSQIICAISMYLPLDPEEKYQILDVDSKREQALLIQSAVLEFIVISRVSDEAESVQREGNERSYREMALKKQIAYLQEELDDMHPESISDARRFEKKIAEAGMNPEAEAEAKKVLNRLKQEGQDSHEYGSLYDYLDFVTTLSWKKAQPEDIDLAMAEEILDEDHYGLTKVKARIVQQIAVMALKKTQAGSILLFVGAPGTGKTSIGKSIARALGREYVRISLGGIRDEAEIRGHRRTYIGAMPGRIMEGVKRSGVSNPVIVLDEVDKLSRDHSGDPASALLEVLDPEQNFSFTDHYMNVPYDLSDVLFVCTANTTDSIPEPLLNRMEVIRFPGYTAVEKFQIAKKHLLPKAMEAMGLRRSALKVTDDAIKKIIASYTAESGVRGLKKQMDILCRHAAVKLVRGEQKSVTVGVKRLPEFLDGRGIRHDSRMESPVSGVVTGLAWTQAGGEILFIETSSTEGGTGKLYVTGQLGDVMKESVQISLTLARNLFPEEAKQWDKQNLHVHVPAGAVPKDGPSAGVTITTALVSLITNQPVPADIAMTGEISLRGNVMPIGGLPEKLMAAQRAGIKRVLIPADNVEDLEDVAEEVKKELEIIPVKRIEDVMRLTGLMTANA